MDNSYCELARCSNWLPDNKLVQSKVSKELHQWVLSKGSLTAALIELSDGDFKVNLLDQKVTLPHFHEQSKLNRPTHLAATVREVELIVRGQAVVFARSIIPLALSGNGPGGLSKLGRTPLGHLLFKDGRIRVSKREFALIQANGQVVTARRTPYEYQGSSILVAEFFLPSISRFI